MVKQTLKYLNSTSLKPYTIIRSTQNTEKFSKFPILIIKKIYFRLNVGVIFTKLQIIKYWCVHKGLGDIKIWVEPGDLCIFNGYKDPLTLSDSLLN